MPAPTVTIAPPRQPKLLDRLRHACRLRHYSLRTEDAYAAWAERYIRFHDLRHPAEMGAAEVTAFLTHLAVDRHVGASTQNQAFCALLFLYKSVLECDPGRIAGVVRANRPKRLPVVLTPDETRRLLDELTGPYRLMGQLLYGSGLRLLECLRLRVKDVDFARHELTVRHGKGGKDRRTMLPKAVVPALRDHLAGVRERHDADLATGNGAVYLPDALDVKFPHAPREWAWQYVFPATKLSVDPRSGERRRHHAHEGSVSLAITAAVRAAKLT